MVCPNSAALTVWEKSLATLSTGCFGKKPILQYNRSSYGTCVAGMITPRTPLCPLIHPFPLRSMSRMPSDGTPFSWGRCPFTGKASNNFTTRVSTWTIQENSEQWVKQLIIQLFNISWDMWTHRNGIKHNTITAAKQREID